ncbi:carbon-phosphorus lyase complex accessory protein (metallo-beta-lactamase superfamily protein) [Escherichia coli]|uniref:Carbon-phosphorus lyase complex accessory protein (Metallo-beta-lactamase superfamily protein) n=1 Tax=Escherichia coli TaxID=562 RepID=A0A2X3JSP4_ECOLX|nr:carbon-phosphorus lyase complex accessory protein (metallo-beta-lactamase superfamily protein) [Escherichia coli]
MSLTLTLTGTGGAQGVPAWGCECAACDRARRSPQYRRQPCSGVVKFNDAITLIDAGLHDLADRWSPGSFQQFLLTHYHMDHVQGLFPLRWALAIRSRFTARRMTRVATICLNIRACLISATQWNRLWYLICRGCRSRRCRLTTQN